MRSVLRGLAGGLLALGIAALTPGPGKLAAQAKKDPAPAKKDPAPVKKPDDKARDDAKEKTVGITTSDGLSLNAYWYQGNALEKNPPDAVLMFPAPGNKVTDSWIALAKALSEKNFSVLLFDWRGCGMNAADSAGPRILENKDAFWREVYNSKLLKPQRTYEDRGLDFTKIIGKSEGNYRYRDFLFNDLLAARFYLDKQNDNKKCNSGRIWIVTEKDGGPMALAFIASEFLRNSMYNPKVQFGELVNQVRVAGKDFVGVTVLSYGSGPSSGLASAVFNNAKRQLGGPQLRDADDYLEHRLAMIMVYGKKEGKENSRSAFSQVKAGGDDETLKKNYKYLREIDNSKLAGAVSGIGLIDPMDSFGAKSNIQEAMVGVSKALPTNKETLERDANKMTVYPRFPAEALGRR
jgi:hypothetical protein